MRLTFVPIVDAELERLGARARVVDGRKHRKIYVDEIFVAVMPKAHPSTDHRAALNVRAAIRRASEGVSSRSLTISARRTGAEG